MLFRVAREDVFSLNLAPALAPALASHPEPGQIGDAGSRQARTAREAEAVLEEAGADAALKPALAAPAAPGPF